MSIIGLLGYGYSVKDKQLVRRNDPDYLLLSKLKEVGIKEDIELVKREQERIALHVYNMFKDIKKVSFWGFNKGTMGMVDFYATVNDNLNFTATVASIGKGAGVYISYTPKNDVDFFDKKDGRTFETDISVVEIVYMESDSE